jgi:hypothetical protein
MVVFIPLKCKIPEFSTKVALPTSPPVLLFWVNDAAILGREEEGQAKLLSGKIQVGSTREIFWNGSE